LIGTDVPGDSSSSILKVEDDGKIYRLSDILYNSGILYNFLDVRVLVQAKNKMGVQTNYVYLPEIVQGVER
jgi:hypothetical protein